MMRLGDKKLIQAVLFFSLSLSRLSLDFFFHDWLHIGDVGYMRIPFRCNKFR
jgi:hypothetical protein